jgi:antitoxin component YwqK of YwqJK toxin-antitoxin module
VTSGKLNLTEVFFETGELRFRYERCLAADGKQWVRNGRFEAFHKNGQLASEGLYEDGLETGLWRDYHENGQLAAEGEYRNGNKLGTWRFWCDDGTPEEPDDYGSMP